MNAKRFVELAWRESKSHVLRSVLMVIGVALGIASVTTLVFAGELAKSFVSHQVERATGKPGVVTLHLGNESSASGSTPAGGGMVGQAVDPSELTSTIGRVDVVEAWAQIKGSPTSVLLTSDGFALQSSASGEILAPAVGVRESLPDLRRVDLVVGRFFDRSESDGAAPVAVIPRPLADRLGGPAASIGRHLAVGPPSTWDKTGLGAGIAIIGVFDPPAAGDGVAYVPRGLAVAYSAATRQPLDARFLIGGSSAMTGAQTANELAADFSSWTGATTSLSLTRAVLKIEAATQREDILPRVVSAIQVFLALVAAVSLFVGAIGLANVTIMAVGERTREIGIRRACGATARDIRLLVLTETVLLTVTGGLVGTWVAVSLTETISGIVVVLTKDLAAAPPLPVGIVVFSLTVAAVVGLVSGWAPARRASNLPVVAALRVQ